MPSLLSTAVSMAFFLSDGCEDGVGRRVEELYPFSLNGLNYYLLL